MAHKCNLACFTCCADHQQLQKDLNNQGHTTELAPLQARAWYEKAYPIKAGNGKYQTMDLSTAGEQTGGDFSQLIKPDWDKAVTYERDGKQVMELPIDPAVKLGFFGKPLADGAQLNFNKIYSRSSFLILGDAVKGYDAYVMTLVADSAWVAGDFAKLDKQSYRNRASDFSGKLLYFKPDGRFVNGYRYNEGKVTAGISGNRLAVSKKEALNYLSGRAKYKTLENGCTTSSILVYTETTCVSSSLGGTYCTAYYDLYIFTICLDEGRQPGSDDGDGGYPPPQGGGTTVQQVIKQAV